MSLFGAVMRSVGHAEPGGLAFGGRAHRAAARSVPMYHPISFRPELLDDAKVIGGTRSPETDAAVSQFLTRNAPSRNSSTGVTAGGYNPVDGVGVILPNQRQHGIPAREVSRHERTHGIIDTLGGYFSPGEIAGMDVPALTKIAAILDSGGRTNSTIGQLGGQFAPFFDELAAHAAERRGSIAPAAKYLFNPRIAFGTYIPQHLRQGGKAAAGLHAGIASAPWLAGAAGASMYVKSLMDEVSGMTSPDANEAALAEQLQSGEITLEEYAELLRLLDDA